MTADTLVEVLVTDPSKGQDIVNLDDVPSYVRTLFDLPGVVAAFIEFVDGTIFYRKLPPDHHMREGLEQLERIRHGATE